MKDGYESGFRHKSFQSYCDNRISILILPYILLELLEMWTIYCTFSSSQFSIPLILCIAILAFFNIT